MPDPSRKLIILCEGQHDCLFIKNLLDDRPLKHATKEEIRDAPRDGELWIIKTFYRDSGLKYLIKDEDGKKRCIDTFCELYDMETDWNMFVVLDSDEGRTLRLFRRTALDTLRKDILLQHDGCLHTTKDPKKHRVFFIPGSLEEEVRSSTRKNLDIGDRDKQQQDIRQFVDGGTDWVERLRSLLVSS